MYLSQRERANKRPEKSQPIMRAASRLSKRDYFQPDNPLFCYIFYIEDGRMANTGRVTICLTKVKLQCSPPSFFHPLIETSLSKQNWTKLKSKCVSHKICSIILFLKNLLKHFVKKQIIGKFANPSSQLHNFSCGKWARDKLWKMMPRNDTMCLDIREASAARIVHVKVHQKFAPGQMGSEND